MTYKAAVKFQGQKVRIRLKAKSPVGAAAEGTFTVLEVSDQSWMKVQRVELQQGGIGEPTPYLPKTLPLRNVLSIEPA